MNQQNERTSLTNGGCDTYTVNIIKKDKNTEKKLKSGLFGFQLCFTLTYCHKFKSKQHFNNTTRKEAHFSHIFFTLVSIYIGVTHTFSPFLDLKGGLFF